MQISIANAIQVARRIGAAAAEVITTNLKMWLGFETSETLGREEVVNGDYSNGLTGWSTQIPSGQVVEVVNNQLHIDYDSSVSQGSTGVNQTILDANKIYQIEVDIESITGTIRIQAGGDINDFNTDGIKTFIVEPTNSILYIIRFNNGTNVDVVINSISVKELTQITPDKSGNNNVGELFTGKALEFDGSTTYVSANSFAGTLSTSDAFTFAIWFNSDKTPTDFFRNILISSGGPQQFTNIFKIGVNPQTSATGSANVGGIYFDDSAAAYNNVVPSSGGVNYNDGQWHRLVVSRRDGSGVQDLSFYVDGSYIGKADCNPLWNNVNLFDFGQEWDGAGTSDHFAGKMSDIQVYDYAWTTDDIAYDYANPNKLAIDNPSTSLSVTNLKAYWALSEGDGLVAYDSGTNLEEEEVRNGDFSDGFDDWSNGSDWSVANDVATLALSDNATNSTLTSSATLVSSKTYVLTYTISNYTSGELALVLGNISIPSTDGDKTFTFTGQTELSVKRKGGATALSITNISVREITASDHGGIVNGATYVDAQPRIPQLGMMDWSKGSNLLTYSEDFSQSVWIKTDTTVVSNFATSPIANTMADKMTFTTTNTQARAEFVLSGLTQGNQYNQSYYLKSLGSDVNIRIGTSASVVGEFVDVTVTSEWQRFNITTTASSTTEYPRVQNISGTINTEILVWGAQMEAGTSAGAYRLTDGAATLNSTVIPNPTIPTQDIFGNAVRDRLNSFNLDGSGYAEVADSTSLGITNGTLQFWLKTTDTDFTILQGAIAKEYIGRTNNNAWSNGGTATISTFIDNAVSSSQPLYDNDWHFYTFTGININLWTEFSIGNETLDGLISDVLIYDGVLTSSQIKNNYNAGLSAHTND